MFELILAMTAKTGVFLSQTPVLASIIVFGLFSRHKKVFSHALILVLFTMIYNLFLKSIWQVPLPPPLQGWAFPSGHMHTSVVFWGWLAYEYKKLWFKEVVFFILCLVGYGLVYQGYHYPVDVLGAVVFGLVSILIYQFLLKTHFFKNRAYCLGLVLGIVGLGMIWLISPENRKPHVWQAFGTLISFSSAWLIMQIFKKPSPRRDHRILRL